MIEENKREMKCYISFDWEKREIIWETMCEIKWELKWEMEEEKKWNQDWKEI